MILQLYNLNSNQVYYDSLVLYLEKFPNDTEAYTALLNKYMADGYKDKFMSLYLQAKEAGATNEEFDAKYKEWFYEVSIIRGGLQDAYSFVGEYAVVKSEDHWGLLGQSGQTVVQPRYDSINVILGDVYPVSIDGEAYFLGTNGEKMIATNSPVEWLSLLSDGCCIARKNDKYALCDVAINVPEQFEYDFLSTSSSQVIAAKKGEKWALMTNTGAMITDYIYEDILIDRARGACIRNGVIFAKKNGKYIMLDASGVQIGTESFDDAKMFASEQPAAVKIGDKWGFVNADGTINGAVKYDEVESFSLGLYAASENEKWGYKNTAGEFVVAPNYDECKPFSANGIALVRIGQEWQYITIKGFKVLQG